MLHIVRADDMFLFVSLRILRTSKFMPEGADQQMQRQNSLVQFALEFPGMI